MENSSSIKKYWVMVPGLASARFSFERWAGGDREREQCWEMERAAGMLEL